MNKIKVVNDNLDSINVSKNIQIEYYEKEALFAINDIKINVVKNSNLQIEIDLKKESKINFNINVLKDVSLNLNILCKGNKGKIQYKYSLDENSTCNVFKYQDTNSIKEMVIVDLNNKNANINYNFKTIASFKETYDYHVFHKADNTKSVIKNNGLCINDGEIIYQVSSFIPKNLKNCIANQNNRIINLTNNKCQIFPNLYIDSNDVEASHSALIGKFSDEEMFYLESRGINKKEALRLLITGFLTSEINDKKVLNKITKDIDKYWR